MTKKKSKAIAGLVLGILSIPCALIPIIGIPVGVVGIVYSIKGIKQSQGIAIAGLVLYDAIVTLKELVGTEESLDINTIRLSMSQYHEDLVTTWILTHLSREPMPKNQLEKLFQNGVRIGYRYYDVYATIGFDSLQKRGLTQNLLHAKKVGLVQEKEGLYQITTLGFATYYKARGKELEIRYEIAKGKNPMTGIWIRFTIIFIFFFLIMYYSNLINAFMIQLRP